MVCMGVVAYQLLSSETFAGVGGIVALGIRRRCQPLPSGDDANFASQLGVVFAQGGQAQQNSRGKVG